MADTLNTPAEGPLPVGFPNISAQFTDVPNLTKRVRFYERWLDEKIMLWANGDDTIVLQGLDETISWVLAMKEELSVAVVILPDPYYDVMRAAAHQRAGTHPDEGAPA